MTHQSIALIAAQLLPCQWAYVVNFTTGNLLAAAVSWAACRLWMRRGGRCSFVSHWAVISISWVVSLAIAWTCALPLVRMASNWQTAYADDYATAWYTMLAWGILFAIAAAAIARILWRRADSRYWTRLTLCIVAAVAFALPCYWWFCSGSFITQLADTSASPSALAGWGVYYVDQRGDVLRRELGSGSAKVVVSAAFGPGETVWGEGRTSAGSGGTILFNSSLDISWRTRPR